MNYLALALAVRLWETPAGELIGDGGSSVGRYQIQKIAVDEINRVCHTHFTYAQRRRKGKEMFMVYAKYLHETRGYDAKQIYQTWNAGDNAVKNNESETRGDIVMVIYDKILAGDNESAIRIARNRRV